MLSHLSIQNLALVKKAELELEPGLTVLSGETGAGKSVIVTALALALGGRSEREFVRHGADRLEIKAQFSKDVTIGRTISKNGQSGVTLNGQRATLAQLRTTAESLGEILGQHANQRLMKEENHLGFLDEFAGLGDLAESVGETFCSWQKSSRDLQRVITQREMLERERELLLFQREEIEKASVEVGEEERLRLEQKKLDAARSLMSSANQITETLDGEGSSILELMRQVRSEANRMAQVDPDLERPTSELYDIQVRLEELRREIEQYGSQIVDDPARIEQINLRLDEIYGLKKKYGGSEDAILATHDAIVAKLQDRPDTSALIEQLQTEVEKDRAEYTKKALELSKKRRRAAARLQKKVVAELADLAIDAAQFEFEFIDEDDPDGVVVNGRAVRPGENGLEEAVIMFSANPGEPLRSLVKTASGGEISRVLLALKAAGMKKSSASPLLVFDEVDAGIGGRTADQVALKLSQLASNSQVVVVTHLHQIARRADAHFAIEKQTDSDRRQVITLKSLRGSAREAELERMVGLPAGTS